MELRQLATDHERQTFGKGLTEARATRGPGFRETSQSQLGRLRLTFGNLYAIFEDESDPVERMLGGFIMYDLASFPLSFPRPEVGHLPPRSVIEGSELWSLPTGIACIAAGAAAAVAGLLQSKAIVLLSDSEARRSLRALRQARIRQSLRTRAMAVRRDDRRRRDLGVTDNYRGPTVRRLHPLRIRFLVPLGGVTAGAVTSIAKSPPRTPAATEVHRTRRSKQRPPDPFRDRGAPNRAPRRTAIATVRFENHSDFFSRPHA